MRVLHVLDHSLPQHSGYVFRTQGILTELRALGIETFHVTSGKHPVPGAPEESFDGFAFYRTPSEPTFLQRLPGGDQADVVRRLRRRLDEVADIVEPDLIHAHSPCLNALAALSVARKKRLPFVYEMRASWEDAAVSHGNTREGSLRYRLSRALETYTLKHADQVVTICEGLRSEVESRGIPAAKVTVVPNAVDRTLSFADVGPLPPGIAAELEGKRLIGFFGSFYGYEGLGLLVDAMAMLSQSHPDVVLVLLGSGPEDEALRGRVQRMGLEDQVRFTGRVEHRDVPAYYGAMSALVYPRLSMRLTDIVTPLKPLEAMLARRVVVASDVGGHRELIRHGETGWLFRAGDVEDIVAKVRAVLDTPSAQRPIVDRAHEEVRVERVWANIAPRYLPVYEQAQRGASRSWNC